MSLRPGGIGLKYTIPLAIENNIEDAQSLKTIYMENTDLIEQFDTTDEIKKEIISAFTAFEKRSFFELW